MVATLGGACCAIGRNDNHSGTRPLLATRRFSGTEAEQPDRYLRCPLFDLLSFLTRGVGRHLQGHVARLLIYRRVTPTMMIAGLVVASRLSARFLQGAKSDGASSATGLALGQSQIA